MKQFLITGWLLVVVTSASATRIEYGKNTVINTPVYEDLYIAGSNVTINAPVYGDLIVAGGTITINDTVSNDILVAGGNVTFNGYVGDDIRCAGGRLKILKDIAGDVIITGGTIIVNKAVTLGNLIASGGEITVDGNVNGMVKSASGKLHLNGIVQKNIDCRGGSITINGTVQGPALLAADNITIGNAASFGNTIRYWTSDKKVDFKQSIKTGQAVYDPSLRTDSGRWYYLGFASMIGVIWYIGMVFLMIMLMQYLFGATFKKAGETAYNTARRSLGYGILFWLGIPVAAALAFVTVIGIPVGVMLLVGYVILLVMATVITALVAANWLNNRSNANWQYWRMVFVALGIFVVLKILTFTPFLGWFILMVSVCIAFGAILQNINWRKRGHLPVGSSTV